MPHSTTAWEPSEWHLRSHSLLSCSGKLPQGEKSREQEATQLSWLSHQGRRWVHASCPQNHPGSFKKKKAQMKWSSSNLLFVFSLVIIASLMHLYFIFSSGQQIRPRLSTLKNQTKSFGDPHAGILFLLSLDANTPERVILTCCLCPSSHTYSLNSLV